MLIRFTVANHRSINEPVELSFVAVDSDRPAVRGFDRLKEDLLTVVAIYGPNASGKSNVVDALFWLSQAVRNSLRAWDQTIPRDPFLFAGAPKRPSLYELDFMFDETRHNYTIELTDQQVNFEELVSYPERKPRTLFTREGTDIRFRRGLGGASAIKDLLTSTTLALTLAGRLEVPELQGPARFVSNINTPSMGRAYGRPRGGTFRYDGTIRASSTSRLFFDAHRYSEPDEQGTLFPAPNAEEISTALSLLRFADLGIKGVEVREKSGATQSSPPHLELRLVHSAKQEEVSLDLSEESHGTVTWFGLLGPVLAALARGQTLVIDELDASLHPILSARLPRLFQDPNTNPRNAQLVFTTHDTSLMGELNRDEVWFTEKSDTGATTLTALAEYGSDRVRRSVNLERAYLQGRFGGLPHLRESELLSTTMESTESGGLFTEESPDTDDYAVE